MDTVVVQAHPLEASLSAALLARVEKGLSEASREHVVVRLGQPGDNVTVDPLDLIGVKELILVYPTWWGGPPAVLLDWLNRVLSIPGSLATIERVVAVTSCGSSRLVNLVQGEWGRRYIGRTILSRCAAGASVEWRPIYKIDRAGIEDVTAFLDSIEASIAVPSLTNDGTLARVSVRAVRRGRGRRSSSDTAGDSSA